MSIGNSITVGIFVVLAILIFLAYKLSLFLTRRAMCKVITVLEDNFAVNDKNAQTLQDLGLDFGFRLRILRDYRPLAFQILLQAGIIRNPLPEKYYLSEEALETNQRIKCQIKLKKPYSKTRGI